ncbi:hypothetical protein [uncultured Clostridium sp.]|nr:hypothetical protein [uncultured Clostridium sp.]
MKNNFKKAIIMVILILEYFNSDNALVMFENNNVEGVKFSENRY